MAAYLALGLQFLWLIILATMKSLQEGEQGCRASILTSKPSASSGAKILLQPRTDEVAHHGVDKTTQTGVAQLVGLRSESSASYESSCKAT